MLYPKQLVNYYYFIESGVVFNISTNNDKDQCGKHYVEYITEQKSVQKGEIYNDKNNTPVEAKSAGTVAVSTGVMDDVKNAAIFPNIKVTTKNDKEETKDYYFWFQYLINDGDTNSGTKFVYKHKDDGDVTDYLDVVKASINEEIEQMASKGYTLEAIKASLPWWVTGKVNDKVAIGGKLETITANTFSSNFPDSAIETLINAKINEMVTDFANLQLKKHGKKICDGLNVTDDAVDIDAEC